MLVTFTALNYRLRQEQECVLVGEPRRREKVAKQRQFTVVANFVASFLFQFAQGDRLKRSCFADFVDLTGRKFPDRFPYRYAFLADKNEPSAGCSRRDDDRGLSSNGCPRARMRPRRCPQLFSHERDMTVVESSLTSDDFPLRAGFQRHALSYTAQAKIERRMRSVIVFRGVNRADRYVASIRENKFSHLKFYAVNREAVDQSGGDLGR